MARKVLLAAGVLVAAAAGVAFFLAARVTGGVRLLVHVETPETWDRTAEDVEHDTLAPMEAALVRAPGVAHVDGLAERGGATVEVSFVPGVSSRDARAAVDGALPASRAARTVALPARAPPLHVVLVGDVYPGADVRSAFARVLRPRLAAVAGVAEITICGGGVPRVLVEVNTYQARGRGVDAMHIVSALQGALATATTAQDLAAATIADQNGSPLRVRDVADVSASSGAPPCDAWRGEQPAVVGIVTLMPDVDVARAAGEISRALGELELGALPPGMHAVPADFDAHGHAPTVELRVYGLGSAGEEATSRAFGRLLDASGAALHEPTTLSFLGRTTSDVEPTPPATILARVPRGRAPAAWADEIAGDIEKGWPGVGVEPIVRSERLPHAVRVHAEDLTRARACAETIATVLSSVAAVRSAKVPGGITRAVRVQLDATRAARYGIDPQAASAVIALGFGEPIGDLGEGAARPRVVVRWHADAARPIDLAALRDIPVPAPSGASVPLGQISTIEVASAEATIAHDDGRRVVDVRVEASVPWEHLAKNARPLVEATKGGACAGADVTWPP